MGCLLAAIVFFVLRAQVPPFAEALWSDGVRRDSVLPVDALVAPPRVGKRFGGSSPDEDDDGYDLKVWLASVVNPDRVLTYGARPTAEEFGPFTFRAYKAAANTSTSGSRVAFLQRQFLIHTGGDLDQQVVVPSLPFRHLEHLVRERSDIVTDSFEDGVAPLLFSIEAARMLAEMPGAVKATLFPELVDAVFQDVKQRVSGATTTSVLDDWRLGEDGGRLPGTANHSLILPKRSWRVADGEGDPGPIASNVALSLWAFSGAWSFLNSAKAVPGGDPRWKVYLLPEGTQLQEAVVGSFARHFLPMDARYANHSTARVHMEQIAQWVTGLVSGSQSSVQDRFHTDVATAMTRLGLLPRPEWSLITAAQLAQNAVSGLAFWVRNQQRAGLYGTLNMTAGPLLTNACPAGTALTGGGASLADYEELPTSQYFAAPPELSCMPYREELGRVTATPPSAIAAAEAGTATVQLETSASLDTMRFRSRLAVDKMDALLRVFTQGTTMTGFSVPGSRVVALFTLRVRQLIASAEVANNVIDVAKSQAPGQEGALHWIEQMDSAMARMESAAAGSQAALAAAADAEDAARNLALHLSSSKASLINDVCARSFSTPQVQSNAPLTCYEMIDVAAWIDYVAMRLVWFPKLVHADPATGLPSSEVFRTGPLVRTRVRNALFGFEDTAYKLLVGESSLTLGPDDETSDQLASRSDTANRIHVDTGAENLDLVGQIVQHGIDPKGEFLWGGFTPVSGAFSKLRTRGVYSRQALVSPVPSPPGGSITVWSPELRRPLSFEFDGIAKSAGGHVNLWNLRQASALSWPYYESDKQNSAPLCMRSLYNLPAASDGLPIGISLMVGKPHFLDCTNNEQAFGYAGMRPANNGTDGSSWQVEPVTGLVASTTDRWGTYLRWAPSDWYPFLRPTIGPLAWFEATTSAPVAALKKIRDDVSLLNYQLDSAVPTLFLFIGLILLALSVLFVYVIFYPLKEPAGADEERRKRREALEQARKEKAQKEEAEAKAAKENMLSARDARQPPKPGSVMMSSILGSVAASPAAGLRGAPSMRTMAFGSTPVGDPGSVSRMQSASGAQRGWPKPALSAGALAPIQHHPTDIVSFRGGGAGGSARMPPRQPSGASLDGKSIRGMTLSQAMRASSEDHAASEIVETPDGKRRRRKVKRGSQTMQLASRPGSRRRSARLAQVAPGTPSRGESEGPASQSDMERRARAEWESTLLGGALRSGGEPSSVSASRAPSEHQGAGSGAPSSSSHVGSARPSSALPSEEPGLVVGGRILDSPTNGEPAQPQRAPRPLEARRQASPMPPAPEA